MFETFKNLLVDRLQIDPKLITADAELSADLGINSLELATLVEVFEEQLNLEVEDDEVFFNTRVLESYVFADAELVNPVVEAPVVAPEVTNPTTGA